MFKHGPHRLNIKCFFLHVLHGAKGGLCSTNYPLWLLYICNNVNVFSNLKNKQGPKTSAGKHDCECKCV